MYFGVCFFRTDLFDFIILLVVRVCRVMLFSVDISAFLCTQLLFSLRFRVINNNVYRFGLYFSMLKFKNVYKNLHIICLKEITRLCNILFKNV